MSELPENIYPFLWIPQNDLLGHNRTKLFITHCGNNGQHESIYQGVPMVAFPLVTDQHHDAFRMTYRGFGVALDIVTFTADELVSAINEVIGNETFSKNVKKASAILRDTPMTPRETAAYWVEHVIKHGHRHLRSHAMNLASYEYVMIDVIAFFVMVVVVLCFFVTKLFQCCCRLRKRITSNAWMR